MKKKDFVVDAIEGEEVKLLDYMGQLDPDSKEYEKSKAALDTLEKMRSKRKRGIHIDPMVAAAMITAFTSLTQVCLVLYQEGIKNRIITTKASWQMAQRGIRR